MDHPICSDDPMIFNLLLSDHFNAPEFINDFLRNVQPGDEAKHLQCLRHSLTMRSNGTAETIKDVVFDHYRKFIDTSKEISNLERDIYQLSTLLTEQKGLIEHLIDMSGHEKLSSCSLYSAGSSPNQQNQQLQTLMQKLDGVASVLNSLGDSELCVMRQGQLVLLDSDSMLPRHPVYIVLLANNLLIGHPTPNSGVHHRYPFFMVANHPIDSLALINVKGFSPIATTNQSFEKDPNKSTEQHLIQLLVFPEQIFLRCENARTKRDWLDSMEEVKKRQQEERALVRQATIRARRRNILSSIANRTPLSPNKDQRIPKWDGSPKRDQSTIGGELSDELLGRGRSKRTAAKPEDTAWLNELVNELQDVISHRHMEQAVEMLLEWKSCVCKDQELNAKFHAIEKQVVELIAEEVKRPVAFRGSSTTLTHIQQLVALGRTAYAVELFLRRRSAALRTSARELTVSEEPLSYVRQVSGIFVNEILEVCQELSPHRDQLCQVLAWSSRELSVLLSLIRRHVIEVAPTMAVLTHTWRILMSKCTQLTPIGLDLSFEVNRLAAPSLKSALEANFANILDSIQLRNSEERWTPFSFESDQNMIRFLEEMSDIGLQMEWAICRAHAPNNSSSNHHPQLRFALNVAQSACSFARTALQLTRDLALLNSSPHLQKFSDSLMRLIWTEQLAHLTAGMHKSLVHHCTSRFIISQVLPLCQKTYQGDDTNDGLLHQLLVTNFPHLLHFRRNSNSKFIFSENRIENPEEEEEVASV